MANIVKHKRSNVAAQVPTAAQVDVGEIALNFIDEKIYSKEPGGTVIEIASKSKWTKTGADIYRNSKVTIGGTAAPVAQVDVQTGSAAHAVAITTGAMDLSVAQMFVRTSTANTTWSFANVPAGRGVTAVLHLTDGGSHTQTWTGIPVKWPGGVAPTLTAAGTDVLVFVTHDGGTTWRGNIFGKDVK